MSRQGEDMFTLGFAPFFSGEFKAVIARLARNFPIDADTNPGQAMRISAVASGRQAARRSLGPGLVKPPQVQIHAQVVERMGPVRPKAFGN